MVKRLQNKVAESRLSLPFMAVIAIIIVLLRGDFTGRWWLQFACWSLSTYLIVELNNVNSLLRIYSRMVSCSFLVLILVASYLLSDVRVSIVTLCIVVAYTLLFHCYQLRKSVNWVYTAFLFIGIASYLFIQILYFVPILWICMTFFLMTMNIRSFFASLLGLITPYCFGIILFVYFGEIDYLLQHFASLIEFQPLFDYQSITINQYLTFAFVVLLLIIGIVHFVRNSFLDKIKTRMFYNIFITMSLACLTYIILQPMHFDVLIVLLIVNVSPLIAHFISLTHTRITNITFIVLLIISASLIFYNSWSHLLTF